MRLSFSGLSDEAVKEVWKLFNVLWESINENLVQRSDGLFWALRGLAII